MCLTVTDLDKELHTADKNIFCFKLLNSYNMPRLHSHYVNGESTPYEIGEVYSVKKLGVRHIVKDNLRMSYSGEKIEVHEGLHSYMDADAVITYIANCTFMLNTTHKMDNVMLCCIPKGAHYYVGINPGNVMGCCSDKIMPLACVVGGEYETLAQFEEAIEKSELATTEVAGFLLQR